MQGLEMKYFVLNPTKDNSFGWASRRAIDTYAMAIRETNEKLSNDLMSWIKNIEADIKNDRLDARDGE